MKKTITITSPKGGVGKTTTALNLGYCLSLLGKKVVVIDGDPQGGISISVNLRNVTNKGIINILKKEARANDIITFTKNKNFSIIGIGNLESEDYKLLDDRENQDIIKRLIIKLKEYFDYVIIDSAYSVTNLLYTYLSASDSVIIPVIPKIAAIKSLSSLLKVLENVKITDNQSLEIEGILITMYRGTDSENKLLLELKQLFPKEIFFKSVIRYSDDFEISNLKGVPIFLLNKEFDLKKDYFDLALELAAREEKGEGEDYAELF